ncbi:MAG: RNA polymerase sigma-70 factor [Bacteroidales bacterium]|nr:RNA polymerase sigma-70 factor [Bacteroidales bacterium]
MEAQQHILAGEKSSFENLFRRYFPRLKTYALRFFQEEDTAVDIVQECFFQFYGKNYDAAAKSAPSLLFAMVRNACIDVLRHRKLVRLESIDYLLTLDGEERLYHADFDFTPQDVLLYDELQSQIKEVIDSLTPKCREVFLMSRFEGLKNKEIAQRINTSVTNVEKHITKALAAFARHFKENYPADVYIAILAWLIRGLS